MARDHADHDRRVAVGRELGPVHHDDHFLAGRDEASREARQSNIQSHLLVGQVAVELLDAVLVYLASPTCRRPSDGSDARPIGVQRADHAVRDRLLLLGVQRAVESSFNHTVDGSRVERGLVHAQSTRWRGNKLPKEPHFSVQTR